VVEEIVAWKWERSYGHAPGIAHPSLIEVKR
jgi:hypothetical protein